MNELPHGSYSTYSNHGCRCDDCKQAARAVMSNDKRRRFRERVLRDGRWFYPGAKHGTYNAYTNYGCRCEECRQANRSYHASKVAKTHA